MAAAPARALVVYSRVGGGHLSAARALAGALESTGQVVSRLVDVYLECGRFPVTMFPAGYAYLVRRRPLVWSMLYYGAEHRRDPGLVLGPFLRRGLKRLMDSERPDLTISVLPAVNGLLRDASSAVHSRLEVVLTDWHSVHRFWVAPGVDYYTTPTDSARADCIRYGAPADRVDVVGIPVRGDFVHAPDIKEVRSRRLADLGLEADRFTILAMVGAEGSPHALRNVVGLAQLDMDAQMIVICGRNQQLLRKLQRLRSRIPVCALGFVGYVADLMRAADVLVTKAGGLTLAEAFCCGVAVVVHDVVPGQESGNLEYVLRRGAVDYARSAGALRQLIKELYADPERRLALAARGAELARPYAARDIADAVLQRLAMR